MSKIFITEDDVKNMVKSVLSRLNEDVYVNKLNDKSKTANITYKTGKAERGTKMVYGDSLGTEKMDQLNSDTIIVPLKGGINSYNITSINGVAVMHYFKNYFDRKKTTIAVSDADTDKKEDYQLKMDEREFNNFKKVFFEKVNKVIQYKLMEFGNVKFEKVSIYPVPSSSKFNSTMAKEMETMVFSGVKGGTQVINQDLFKKDLKNLEVDTDFIEHNKDYYNSPLYSDQPDGETHMNSVVTNSNKYRTMSSYIDVYVAYINRLVKEIMTKVNADKYYAKTHYGTEFTNTIGERIAPLYQQLASCYEAIYEKSKYWDDYAQQYRHQNKRSQLSPIKYAKTPVNEYNTEVVWELVLPYIKTYKTNLGQIIKKMPIAQVQKGFGIKKVTNDIRMGMRNYFSADMDVVQQELEKIKNTVFVVFDDNISGGATLSDICLQAKRLGIEYIIPITFGKMRESYSKFAGSSITKPENNMFNTDFSYTAE